MCEKVIETDLWLWYYVEYNLNPLLQIDKNALWVERDVCIKALDKKYGVLASY